MATLVTVVLVLSLVSQLVSVPPVPGVAAGQAAGALPLYVIAAAVILLLATSRTDPQSR